MTATSPPAHPLTPYLCCRDAASALAFYAKAFGAVEKNRFSEPNGRIGHAELAIGGAAVMVSDEYPELGVVSPAGLRGTTVALHLYVADADATVRDAVAAGATLEQPVEDQVDGDRRGTIRDPFGHRWMISTRGNAPSRAELQRKVGDAYEIR
jgi:uncharacterized glyoxalase superfamily protein PhnB